jgi:nucleotide-binding universal stress UspA family protein
MAVDNVVAFQRRSPMFDIVLAPTDGSAVSISAALKALAFAKRMDARVVVFNSIPAYQYPVYVGGMPYEYPSEIDYETQCRAIADRHLGLILEMARTQGVNASSRIEFNGAPAQAIVDAATRDNCGLIFMGSHGRSGLSRVFLGSVTFKALALTHIPVLVDRATPEEILHVEELMRQRAIES